MAQSIKLTDNNYIDASGVYDSTQNKTQAEINGTIKSMSVSGTTDANGNFSIGGLYNHCLIGAYISTPAYASYRFCSVDNGLHAYLKIGTNSPTDDPYVGYVEGYVYYI